MNNNFDDDSIVYIFPDETRVRKIKDLKPYIIFKRSNSFCIETLPLVMRDNLKSTYGEVYEVFYDSYSVNEYKLNSQKIDYVKTSVGEIKKEIDREIKEDTKYLIKDR